MVVVVVVLADRVLTSGSRSLLQLLFLTLLLAVAVLTVAVMAVAFPVLVPLT